MIILLLSSVEKGIYFVVKETIKEIYKGKRSYENESYRKKNEIKKNFFSFLSFNAFTFLFFFWFFFLRAN